MVAAYADVVSYEDWGKMESRIDYSTRFILDMLESRNTKATFFVLGWIARHHPKLVQEIYKRGHEVASHGYSHRMIFTQTPEQFREDVRAAKQRIEDITGEAVLGYRAPSYSITKKTIWALDLLRCEGYLYDSSIFPVHHDRYGYPGFARKAQILSCNGTGRIVEIPPATLRIRGNNLPIAGGGYMRLFPFRLISWGIRRINRREKMPAVVYLHPWELDPDQPRIKGRMLSNLRHNLNLKGTVVKFRRLLDSFRFAPMRDVFGPLIKEAAS